jgi:hypothetical protein
MTNNERESLFVAVHVLWAFTNYRQPLPADVEFLRSLFPEYPEVEPDELACMVILPPKKLPGSAGSISQATGGSQSVA